LPAVPQTVSTFPTVADAIAQALAEAPSRVRVLETEAGRLWLKRVEHLSLRWRLQKGSGRRSFEKDREGLHVLGDAGLPVAPILAEGPDFFVTPDLGVTLRAMMRDGAEPEERAAAFAGAGRALAALHSKGYSHGRPAVRDLCWNGSEVRFIDMEKFSASHRSARYLAQDMLVFVHSVLAAGGQAADLDPAISAYRADAGEDRWGRVVALARRWRWLAAPARALGWLRPGSRELAAVSAALLYVAGIA
jgi:tRNA A-37 threonylcarbamoyl transferase component Bud32